MILSKSLFPEKNLMILCLMVTGLFLLPASLSAQGCDPNEIINMPGIYKGPSKGSVRDVPKEDLLRQQAITQKFINMVVDNYQPKGMNISYGQSHSSPRFYKPNGLNLGNHYNTHFFLMYFYCDYTNNMAPVAETHSIIEFRVNEWKYPSSFFVQSEINEVDPETDVFTTIKHKPVWNESGYWTMTDTVYIVRDLTNFHHIVTKKRELPFVYMSKKEFLEKLRVYYEKQIQVTINSWKNPTPDEAEYAKKRIEGDKSFYGKSIQNIDDFLANSPEEVLNEPATVVGGGPPSEFEGFKNYGSMVIKPNPKYYDPKAPNHTPHFIDVLFQIYEPEKACLNAKNDILKIIDFKVLQEIVDKGGVPLGTTNLNGSKPAGTLSNKK